MSVNAFCIITVHILGFITLQCKYVVLLCQYPKRRCIPIRSLQSSLTFIAKNPCGCKVMNGFECICDSRVCCIVTLRTLIPQVGLVSKDFYTHSSSKKKSVAGSKCYSEHCNLIQPIPVVNEQQKPHLQTLREVDLSNLAEQRPFGIKSTLGDRLLVLASME